VLPLDEAAIFLVAGGLNPRHAKIRRLGLVGSGKYQEKNKQKVNDFSEFSFLSKQTKKIDESFKQLKQIN
jgi:hypothetical protein